MIRCKRGNFYAEEEEEEEEVAINQSFSFLFRFRIFRCASETCWIFTGQQLLARKTRVTLKLFVSRFWYDHVLYSKAMFRVPPFFSKTVWWLPRIILSTLQFSYYNYKLAGLKRDVVLRWNELKWRARDFSKEYNNVPPLIKSMLRRGKRLAAGIVFHRRPRRFRRKFPHPLIFLYISRLRFVAQITHEGKERIWDFSAWFSPAFEKKNNIFRV